MNEIIRLENVSKKYKINYGSSSLRNKLPDFFRNLTSTNKINNNEYKALDSLSFSIPKGTTLGIIGSNGSGKSTLLKLITKVTYPTSGNIYINGSVASLLEIGAGFHIDFTGRENIYLNGALLGLTKKQIDNKFEQIVEFSELKDFIDTPIKKYSSGMHVKLGFAIAIHVNPDILLVDEVLSVGDANFQNKCIKKMREIVSDKNKTVILVSHNMVTIQALCDKVMWLEKGKLRYLDETNKVISLYSEEINKREFNSNNYDRVSNSSVYCSEIELYDFNVQKKNIFSNSDKKIIINLSYKVIKYIDEDIIILFFLDSIDLGCPIASFSTKDKVNINTDIGEHNLKCEIDISQIYPRELSLRVEIRSKDIISNYDLWEDASRFIIKPDNDNTLLNSSDIIRINHKFT